MVTRSSSAEPKPLAAGFGTGAAARGVSPSPRVIARGAVVAVQAFFRAADDIHSVWLAIVRGAQFDGRCRRADDASLLTADLPS